MILGVQRVIAYFNVGLDESYFSCAQHNTTIPIILFLNKFFLVKKGIMGMRVLVWLGIV